MFVLVIPTNLLHEKQFEYSLLKKKTNFKFSFGLWLKGDRKENFTPIKPYRSGLNIVGDKGNTELISIQKKKHLLVAKNNDYLQLIKIN